MNHLACITENKFVATLITEGKYDHPLLYEIPEDKKTIYWKLD